MSKVTLKQLLAAGAHFGHLTSRWDPRMKPYIFTKKNGIHIIDIKKTVSLLAKAQEEIAKISASGEDILFVGTKKQAKEIVKTEAARSGSYYIDERWLGGTLTNFATIKKSIRHLKDLDTKSTDGTYENITKKEILMIEREKDKMNKVLAGIKEMKRLPGAVFVIDIKKENIAVHESKKLGLPVFAIVDSNVNPENIDYPIPANDDAAHSIALITKALADSVIEGRQSFTNKKDEEAEDKRIKESKVAKEKDEAAGALPAEDRKVRAPKVAKVKEEVAEAPPAVAPPAEIVETKEADVVEEKKEVAVAPPAEIVETKEADVVEEKKEVAVAPPAEVVETKEAEVVEEKKEVADDKEADAVKEKGDE